MLAAAFLFLERMGSLEFSLQAVRFFGNNKLKLEL
jgi:hypothetical protein